MENITLKEIFLTAFSGIGVFFLGLLVKYFFDRKNQQNQHNSEQSVVHQEGNIVGGDMAGGNIIKKTRNEKGNQTVQ